MIKHCTAGYLLRIVVPKKEQTLLNYSTSSSQEGLYVLKKIHMDKNKEVDFLKKKQLGHLFVSFSSFFFIAVLLEIN